MANTSVHTPKRQRGRERVTIAMRQAEEIKDRAALLNKTITQMMPAAPIRATREAEAVAILCCVAEEGEAIYILLITFE